ncbi:MAG: ROK family protein [Planctomycetaceae bacterium]|nr:ROK family protein [Planctomycetaceae bacterium]
MSTQTITREEAIAPYFIGVDVGGTSIKIGVVDDLGRTLAYTSFPTEGEKDTADAIRRITSVVRHLLDSSGLSISEVAGVGLGTPGPMDIKRGYILDPTNIPGWRHYPIRERLAEAIGKPVTYANDANAAAYGEYWVGTGKNHPSLVMITLGTGVGGGIIIGDLSVEGENSFGSEVGHIAVDYGPQARMCPCGQPGHLEAYASATAVIARTIEQIEAGRPCSLRDVLTKTGKLTGLQIAQAAEAGDELALDVILTTADYLARGIVILMHTIDPAAIVLGGAMNFGGSRHPLGQQFLKRVKEGVDRHTFPLLAQRIVIEYASLGGDAGYLGAAGLARAARKSAGN